MAASNDAIMQSSSFSASVLKSPLSKDEYSTKSISRISSNLEHSTDTTKSSGTKSSSSSSSSSPGSYYEAKLAANNGWLDHEMEQEMSTIQFPDDWSSFVPPRVVIVLPQPDPYVQLCFDPEEDDLVTAWIGKKDINAQDEGNKMPTIFLREPFDPWDDSTPDLAFLSSTSDSTSNEGSDGCSSSHSSCSNSTSESSSTSVSSGIISELRRNILWMDERWLVDLDDIVMSDNYEELGLLESTVNSVSGDAVLNTCPDDTGCGRILMRSITHLCSKRKQKNATTANSCKTNNNVVDDCKCVYTQLR